MKESLENPESLVLKIDEKEILNEKILGTQGEIQLPPLSIGTHVLNINSSSAVKFFISQIRKKENAYLKRQLILLKKGKTEFTYKKTDKEAVILTVYIVGQPQTEKK